MTSKKAKEAGAKPMNRSLSAAKAAKQDEFYTQYVDIQKEIEAEPAPIQWTPRSAMSVIHGRPVRSLATNREPAVGG